MAVFDGIDAGIIQMPRIVFLVADDVLPGAPLPDSALTAARKPLRVWLMRQQALHKADLDRLPAVGVIVISWWQGPYAVHMIWQDYPGIDKKRSRFPGDADGVTHGVNASCQQAGATIQQVDGKEVGPTGHSQAAVVGQGDSIDTFVRDENRSTAIGSVGIRNG